MGLVAAMAIAGASSVMATTDEFDYASVSGANIVFGAGGVFNFTPNNSFQITDSSLGPAANGLVGGMTGNYTIGTITSPTAGLSIAAVTGTGPFFINDGAGHLLTGTLVWNNIEQFGTGSTVNYLASVNLTGLAYSGANANLLHLAGQNNAIDTLNFTFTGAPSLATLAAGGLSTSFSGTINSVPGAMVPDGGLTVALMGGSLVALAGLRRKLVC